MDECGISGVLRTEDTLFGIVKSGGTIQGRLNVRHRHMTPIGIMTSPISRQTTSST